MSNEIMLTDKEAYITKVEDLGLGAQMVEWECGGPDDRTSSDWEWPGEVRSMNNDGKIGSGWVVLEGVNLSVGDVVPAILKDYRLEYNDGTHYHEYDDLMSLADAKAEVEQNVRRYFSGEPQIEYIDWDGELEAIVKYPIKDDAGQSVALITLA